MEGLFVRRKTGSCYFVLLLLSGICLAGLYGFLMVVDPEDTGGTVILLIAGILISLAAVFGMGFNRGAFLRIGEQTIRAKYHWFGNLDCGIQEVAFVLPQANTLTILLKSGKRHTIMGVENAWAISCALRRELFAPETERPDDLRKKLAHIQAQRKKALWKVWAGVALLFGNIFIAVALTGGKDPEAFGKGDWFLFGAMGVIEMLTLVWLFYAAGRCGRYLLPMEQLKYRLRGALIAATPLPSNIVRRVYTEENHLGRIAVCGFPNDESVYYCVEKCIGKPELKTVYRSEVFRSEAALPQEDFDGLIDITNIFSL